jgi:hypothetical protein
MKHDHFKDQKLLAMVLDMLGAKWVKDWLFNLDRIKTCCPQGEVVRRHGVG